MGKSNSTKAQPAEIFSLDMDFRNRLAVGESISAAASVVKVYDEAGTDKSATHVLGNPVVTGTKLAQKIKWATAQIGTKYKVSFLAKVGTGTYDNLYEEDVTVEIFD